MAALNRALPADIRVVGWCPVPEGFSARFSCLRREYLYFFVRHRLDVEVNGTPLLAGHAHHGWELCRWAGDAGCCAAVRGGA